MPKRSVVPVADRIAAAPAEIAGLLQLSVDRVRKAIDDGELPAYRAGRRILVLTEDARQWVRQMPAYSGTLPIRRSAKPAASA